MESSQPPRLLDQVRQAIRFKHYSLKTEKSYVYYIRDFILFIKSVTQEIWTLVKFGLI